MNMTRDLTPITALLFLIPAFFVLTMTSSEVQTHLLIIRIGGWYATGILIAYPLSGVKHTGGKLLRIALTLVLAILGPLLLVPVFGFVVPELWKAYQYNKRNTGGSYSFLAFLKDTRGGL